MFLYTSADVTEKLNFLWSSLILLVFALLIGALRYLYLPSLISCWTPAQFLNSHILYTLQTCWSKNTTYLPMQSQIPVATGSRSTDIETYHSFIPVIIVLLIIGFKIPEAIKALLDLCTGSTPKSLVSLADSWEERSDSLAECGRDIVKRKGIMKTMSFFLVKILILANLLVQFIFVRSYFRDSASRVKVDNVTTQLQHNIIFPKVILCDFPLWVQGVVQHYTVQCQMPVNYLYQEFFTIYGFWILGIGLFTGATFLFHLGTLMVPALVGIRFRGIIPDKELKLRGFSVDDALLYLEDVRDEFGIAMARSVASKMLDTPKSIGEQPPVQPVVGGDGFQEIAMTTKENGAADTSISPLLDNTTPQKTEIV